MYIYLYMRYSTVCSKCFKLYANHPWLQPFTKYSIYYCKIYKWLCEDEAKLLRVRHMGTSQSITVFVLFCFISWFFSFLFCILWNGVRSGSNKIISCEPATNSLLISQNLSFFSLCYFNKCVCCFCFDHLLWAIPYYIYAFSTYNICTDRRHLSPRINCMGGINQRRVYMFYLN